MNSPKRRFWFEVIVWTALIGGSFVFSSGCDWSTVATYDQIAQDRKWLQDEACAKHFDIPCDVKSCQSAVTRMSPNDVEHAVVSYLLGGSPLPGPNAPVARAPMVPCPAISFDAAAGEITAAFDPSSPTSTTIYNAVIYRQADGNYTAQGFSVTHAGATSLGSQAQAQGYWTGCRGINSPTPGAHTNLLADMPGASSRQLVVTNLGGAPYAAIAPSNNSNAITVALDSPNTLGNSLTDYAVPGVPLSILTADFNGDGKRDVAVISPGVMSNPGNVSILLGNGDGTLRAASNYTVGKYPVSMTWHDFNHDGRADLAVANQTSRTVTVLLANPDGSMGTGTTYNLPGTASQLPVGIVAADFDGDGKADLMVYSTGLGFTLLHGNGNGAFQVMPQLAGYTPAYVPAFLAAGDFNKDGKVDLATLNGDGTASILLNAGDGSFPKQTRYVVGSPLSAGVSYPAVFAMDFNDDGNLDLVFAQGHPDALYPNPVFVTVLFGKGDGTFVGAPVYGVGTLPVALAAADFNGDGHPDLITAAQSSTSSRQGSLYVLRGQSGGTFQAATELPMPGTTNTPAWVTAADVNQDGRPDLIATDTIAHNVDVWLGNGDGTFQAAQSYAAGANPRFVAAADLNGDGRADLVVASGFVTLISGADTSVLVLLAKSGGGFNAAASVPTGTNTFQVALADVNGDGKPDLIAVNAGYPAASPAVAGSVSVSLGKGDGTFQAPVNYTVGVNPVSVAVADVNGDGKPDLIVGTITADAAKVAVLLGAGNGTFSSPTFFDTWSWPSNLTVADFDHDGKLDLAIVHWAGDGPVTFMKGNGDGTFQDELTVWAGDTPVAAVAADFSGSGKPDLAVVNGPGSGNGFVGLFHNISPGISCTFSLDSTSKSFAATGGSGSFNVTADSGCAWTATSNNPDWISITAGGSGTGNGTVNFSVTKNTGAARSGTITAAGQTFTVNQSAASAPSVPLAVSVDPAAGNWGYATYTFTFSDSGGWQNISVANVLINNFVDGRNACYVAVVPSSSSVYLVDDAGDAGGPYQGMVLPGSGTVQNSQCSIAAAGSSIAGSGNTLTVTLAVTFKQAFAGNKVMYLAARESGGANSGWQALGTCGVPGSSPTGPAVGGVTPAHSSGAGGGTFTFTFTDTNGWQDLGVVNVLVNDALNGNGACYLAYSRTYNVLYLVNDAGNGLLPGLTLNGAGTLGNSQCTVTGAGSSASGAGNTLTLTLNLSFASAFAGNRVIYMAARSNGDVLNSGWQAVGSRTVQ